MARFAAAVVTGILLTVSQVGLAQEEGQYQIENRNSGKMLAVNKDPQKPGGKIIQESAKDSATQQWKLVNSGDYFKIVNGKSGKVLTAPKPSDDVAAAQVMLGNDTGGKNQQWSLEKRQSKGKTYYVIKSRSDGLVLDVQDANKVAGAHVIHWPFNPKGERANQLWTLVPGK